jgi:hypothetical protein
VPRTLQPALHRPIVCRLITPNRRSRRSAGSRSRCPLRHVEAAAETRIAIGQPRRRHSNPPERASLDRTQWRWPRALRTLDKGPSRPSLTLQVTSRLRSVKSLYPILVLAPTVAAHARKLPHALAYRSSLGGQSALRPHS